MAWGNAVTEPASTTDFVKQAVRLLDLIAMERDAVIRSAALDKVGVRLGKYLGDAYAEADLQRAMSRR